MKIGHAHLKVRNLKRAISFYEEFLGLEVVERVGGSYAFLTSGSMHHEIALHSAGPDAPTPPPGGTGLYPVAFEVPDKHSLADAYTKLTVAEVPVSAVDHVISRAISTSRTSTATGWRSTRIPETSSAARGSGRAATSPSRRKSCASPRSAAR